MRYPSYPSYRTSRFDDSINLPETWEERRLKFIASYNDEALPETTDPDYEIEYVDISSVDLVNGITNQETVCFDKAPSRARRIVRDGDTVVSTVRTYLKAIASIETPPDNLIVSTGFAVIRPNNEIDKRYLSYFLQCQNFVELVVANSVGVSYPAINAMDLVSLPAFFPKDKNEQQKIAAFLDYKTQQIDQLIAKKKALIEKLEEKRIAVITQAVTKGLDKNVKLKPSGVDWLGDVPEHWEVRALKFCCDFLNNRRIPLSADERTGMERNYPYYGASGIIDYVDDYIYDEPTVLIAEDGANLLSRSTDLAFIAKGKYWVNNHAHILKPIDEEFDFWAYLLCIVNYEPWVTGSAQPKLSKENLGIIPLPHPPVSEQSEISDYIRSQVAKIEPLKAKALSVVERLQEYRSALITSAVTGKIDVRQVAIPKEMA